MKTVSVELKGSFDNSYDITVDESVSDRLVNDLCEHRYGKRPVVICDENTSELFGIKLVEILAGKQLDPLLLTVPAGEESKSLNMFSSLLEGMLEAGITRQDVVVALGGGVVGDLSGYVAGSYMRGLNFVQVPTTLLSQVDSSVGGKVAVNIPGGKNYCGMFYQPKAVFAGIEALNSLEKKEVASGLGEVVKHGIIADREFTLYLDDNAEAVHELESEVMKHIVSRCCEIKADVVRRDEKEGGVRRILNYGHTVGHAIETNSGYSLTHGECVAWGMRIIGAAANAAGLFSNDDLEIQNRVMDRLGLAVGSITVDTDAVMAMMKRDKKVKDGKIVMIVPRKIGEVEIMADFPLELIAAELDKF
ncbi:3-dehydroquinate synthase [Maridesulfovibrio bastinii]|uniref:3-dehydroquinate synthase n=1 Tax=Maridesulfovibrio bastinii TaxID=47157 RepID=UPI0003FC3D79|nr:3-dehydroquinate synthase [Maridesulfovibrio bastinii]